MTATMRHDQVLHDMQAGVAAHRTGNAIIDSFGAGNFFIAVFGDPVHDENWGWLITGHHLGATFTVAGSRVTFMPLFLGAQPDLVETGPSAGEMVLSYEASRAQELLRSLTTKQRETAVLSTSSFRDVVAGPGRRQSLTSYEGIPGSALNGAQQTLLWALVEEYIRNADFEPANAQLDAIKTAGLGALHFSWRGPAHDDGAPFYYRIHGPRIIIEYAVETGNHIHTITRDPVNDYGSDWLGVHYEEHSHG